MKPITYTTVALKALRRMPANTAKWIRGKIKTYARDPAAQANDVKVLKGREGVRLRMGDWRVRMAQFWPSWKMDREEVFRWLTL